MCTVLDISSCKKQFAKITKIS